MKVGDHDEADHRSRDDVHQRQGRDGRQHQQEYDGSDASIADTGARYLFLQGALTECWAAHFGRDRHPSNSRSGDALSGCFRQSVPPAEWQSKVIQRCRRRLLNP